MTTEAIILSVLQFLITILLTLGLKRLGDFERKTDAMHSKLDALNEFIIAQRQINAYRDDGFKEIYGTLENHESRITKVEGVIGKIKTFHELNHPGQKI